VADFIQVIGGRQRGGVAWVEQMLFQQRSAWLRRCESHVACAFANGSAIGFSASGREGASEYPALLAELDQREKKTSASPLRTGGRSITW